MHPPPRSGAATAAAEAPTRVRDRSRPVPHPRAPADKKRGIGIPGGYTSRRTNRIQLGSLTLEHKNHDKVFFITSSVVLGILVGIALTIGVIAHFLAPKHDGLTAEQTAAIAARIQPVTQVFTDPTALQKASIKPARAPMSGEQVVAKVCGACHMSGVLNAPKIGDKAAWSERMAKQGGLDGIVSAAIKGLNAMPPRGGDPDLSDAEIHAAVEKMVKDSGI